MTTNFGAAAADYAKYRAGFPSSIFDRLAKYGIGEPGQFIVDLGTGTGTLARGFAGRGCRVYGIDPDERLLEQARQLDQKAGVSVKYRKARAEATGLSSQSVDVITAGQCWHWFDRAVAAQEAVRVLKPGGLVVIAHFDWLPRQGNLVEATEKLIEFHNPHWKLGGGTGIYPQWQLDLSEAGFKKIDTFFYDVDIPYTPESWRGRIRASAGVGASLDPKQVRIFDSDLVKLLRTKFPDDILKVPHRVFAIVARNGHNN